jgi:hypothetical protein
MTVGLLSFASFSLTGTSVVGGFGPNAFVYMNFAKQASSLSGGTAAWPGILSADGYPTSAPSSTLSGNYSLPIEYFGRHRLSFSGQGSFALSGPPIIIYSGGASVNGIGTPTGSVAFGIAILGQSNPNVEFAFGALIASVTNNGSGLVRLTGSIALAFVNVVNGNVVQINNVANLTGQFVVANQTNTTIDLVGSTFSASMVPATGGPGPQAEAILSMDSVTFQFPTIGPYASMSNLIQCMKSDIDGTNPFGLQNGYQCNADLVAQIKQLNPKYLRLMESSAVINSTETNYTYRPKVTNFSNASSNEKWYPDYWVGALTNGGSSAFTCSNPTASGSGAYVDGEVVQGQLNAANTNVNPTINVNSRGAAPIFDQNATLQNLVISGSPTTGDVISITFTGSYISGSPHVLHYTVLSSDNSLNALGISLTTAIDNDTTLAAAGITATWSTNQVVGTILYNVNAGSGTTFSVSVSGAATETITLGRFAVGALATSQLVTLTYSAVLGGWILATPPISLQGGGLNGGMPTETMCELCNRANVGLWVNIPLLYTNTSVTSLISNVVTNLNASLPLSVEYSNEVWNFSQGLTFVTQNMGLALGFPADSLRSIYGFYALRVRQFMQTVASTWTGVGRSRSLLNCAMLSQAAGNTSLNNTYRFQGTDLTTTNAFYAAKGGPGATAGTTYTSVGSRPIDFCDSVGYATYWYGACFGQGASEWTGTLSNFAAALQAGADYASGNTTSMANALTAVFNDVVSGTLGTGNDASQTINALISEAAGWYTIISGYDSARSGLSLSPLNTVLYEGGNQVSFQVGAQGFTTSPAPLATQFGNNGWNTTPYGASNTIVAQQILNLWFAFLNSSVGGSALTTLYNGILAQNPGRKVSPAQFQYEGPALWSLFPGDPSTTPFQTYNAIQAFNSVAH